MSDAAKTLVIGLGNPFRRDDGAGRAVARHLRELHLPDVAVREESGEGAALIEAWKGYRDVIVIDAARSGAAPGTIHRLEANQSPIPSRFFHYSTHAFSVAEAIELARALHQLPRRLIVFGIEGHDFSAGQGLSPEVEKALDDVVDRVRAEIEFARKSGAQRFPSTLRG